jgi:hypothetical protein
MSVDNKRTKFSPKSRRIIAMRSGYRCAHPECDGRTTVGPARPSDAYEDTGRAAHIFAASKRGPRGHGNLIEEELRSVTNGIWLCAKHADQVDINDGKDYPPSVLLGWKAAHEFRIAREHGAMVHPFGWIESLEIIDTPIFRPNQRLTFANLNVIVGGNGVGKTALCEWLWTLKDSSTLWRWGAYPTKRNREYRDVRVAINFRAPARQRLIAEIVGGRTRFSLNGETHPFSPVGYEIVPLRRDRRLDAPPERYRGDPDYIARALEMGEIEVQALADCVNQTPGVFLKGTRWQETEIEEGQEPLPSLSCRLAGGHEHTLQQLSGGEIGAVLLDLVIARARIFSRYRPTLLFIETDALTLSEDFLSEFLRALASPDIPFQTILVTTYLGKNWMWGGWQVIYLHRARMAEGVRQPTEIVVGNLHPLTE